MKKHEFAFWQAFVLFSYNLPEIINRVLGHLALLVMFLSGSINCVWFSTSDPYGFASGNRALRKSFSKTHIPRFGEIPKERA